jgi:8-oxo-dGTP pyrophosphatase MutT (NUDIX family)
MALLRRSTEGGKRRSPVRGAGGVVWKPSARGGIEVAVIHRPAYDDWTLPKGKLQPEEDELEAALREVEEETGLRCTAGDALGASTYVDHQGRKKVVRYWSMRPVGGRFHPSREVDELRWVSLAAADELLTYGRDRALLRAFTPRP